MGKPREVLALAAAAVPALLLYFSAAAAGGQGAGRIQGKTGDDPVGRLTGKYNRLLKDPGASSGRSGWFSWCHGVGARYRRLYVPVQTIGRKGGTKEEHNCSELRTEDHICLKGGSIAISLYAPPQKMQKPSFIYFHRLLL